MTVINVSPKKEYWVKEKMQGSRWSAPMTRTEAEAELASEIGTWPYNNPDGWVTTWVDGGMEVRCLTARLEDGSLIVQYPPEGDETVFPISSEKEVEKILIRETAKMRQLFIVDAS